MPVINNAAAAGWSTAQASEKKPSTNELSPDDFIRLFLAQLKHQNPMNPTDSSAILQQMSQISTISASKSMEKTMESLEKRVEMAMANSQLYQASGLIGHQVELESGSGILSEGGTIHGSVAVSDPADEITVTVKDPSGNTVRTLHCGPVATPGLVGFDWDGKDEGGNHCAAGTYRISAAAVSSGVSKSAGTAVAFRVNSVAMDASGNTVLNTEGMGGVLLRDVIKVL